MRPPARLLLEDGTVFCGRQVGAEGMAVGEVVFNTAMTGYQEILTDPSYRQQIITLTCPHVGNVGTNGEDSESSTVFASGLVLRDVPLMEQNWRSECSLPDFLKLRGVVAICDVDTRRLTRHLRDQGAKNGVLYSTDYSDEEAKKALLAFRGLSGTDLAAEVSTSHAYDWDESVWCPGGGFATRNDGDFYVVAYDFGIKRTILRILTSLNCKVRVVPAKTPVGEVLSLRPDGVFLSNGPGDPEPCFYAIESVRKILDAGIPLFGICLGHQLLSLACGARTVKMKFGHHGANHPVEELATGKVLITSQNHGFCVDESFLPSCLSATHRSLFDQSLQGVHHTGKPAFGFQGHPEASPGPHDLVPFFSHFMDLMKDCAKKN